MPHWPSHVEQQRIALDAPVTRYLPWFGVLPAEQTTQVTVRRLLNQTSGFAAGAGGRALQYLDDVSIIDTARRLAGSQLLADPGSKWEYANGNYVLLGALVEAVSGQGYGTYLQQNVLDPLAMSHTYTALEPARRNRMTEGHRYWFGWPRPHISYSAGLVPAGGVISTAEDMSRYLLMFLNGGAVDGRRVLSEAGIATLQQPAADAEVGPWAKDSTVAYGMGLFVGGGPFGPQPAVFHPSGSPDSAAMLVILPEQRSGLVMLMNVTPEIEVPGAAGAIDRIPAGAISILMGSTPATGWTMRSYYVVFDLLVVAFVGGSVWALVRALRHRPDAPRSRGRGAWRVCRSSLALLGGGLLLAGPAVLGVGWDVLFLSVPDLAVVLLVLGILLVAIGSVRLVRLANRRFDREGPADTETDAPADSDRLVPTLVS